MNWKSKQIADKSKQTADKSRQTADKSKQTADKSKQTAEFMHNWLFEPKIELCHSVVRSFAFS